MTDDRTETITDPAAIRATDEPDPFRRNPVRRTGPDDPWRFTRFVADDHECVIVRDEYDEPAPFGSCSTHRRALSSPVALGCTTPAPVGAAVALDLDAIEARFAQATADEVIYELWPALVAEVRRKSQLAADNHYRAESAEAEVGTLRDTLARRTDSHTQLVRENEALRAKVAEGRRIVGMLAETVVSECEDDPEMCHGHDRTDDGRCPLLVDLNRAHAALAVTTGGGQ